MLSSALYCVCMCPDALNHHVTYYLELRTNNPVPCSLVGYGLCSQGFYPHLPLVDPVLAVNYAKSYLDLKRSGSNTVPSRSWGLP